MLHSEIVAELTSLFKKSAVSLGIDTDNISVSDEADYSQDDTITADSIALIVRFGKATVDGVQTQLPITISAISTGNAIEPCQNLLTQFVSDYNLKVDTVINSIMIWLTPSVAGNFNEVAADYRSTFEMEGTLVISDTAQSVSLTVGGADVFSLRTTWQYAAQPDPQPFASTNGIDITEIQSAAHTLTVSTYALPQTSNSFIATVISIALSDNATVLATKTPISIAIGGISRLHNMVVTSAQITQPLGGFATITFTMTDASEA